MTLLKASEPLRGIPPYGGLPCGPRQRTPQNRREVGVGAVYERTNRTGRAAIHLLRRIQSPRLASHDAEVRDPWRSTDGLRRDGRHQRPEGPGDIGSKSVPITLRTFITPRLSGRTGEQEGAVI